MTARTIQASREIGGTKNTWLLDWVRWPNGGTGMPLVVISADGEVTADVSAKYVPPELRSIGKIVEGSQRIEEVGTSMPLGVDMRRSRKIEVIDIELLPTYPGQPTR